MVGSVRADNTNAILLHVLRAGVGEMPTLIVLEDAHWMDSASWALARHVARSIGPALFVVASRPDVVGFPDEYRALLDRPGVYRLRLETLSTDDTLALALLRLGVDALPGPAADLIREKAQGNPFYCEELAYALRESGLLAFDGTTCRVAPGVDLEDVSIPDHVEGIINGRFDRLPPAQQLTLKVASVIGRLFAVRLLHDVYPIETDLDRLPIELDSLAKTELILEDEPEPDMAYIFRHVITRDVVYDLMPFAQRRGFHRAVASWYERTQAGDLAPYYPLLAHHWTRAEDDVKAVDYLEKAGEQALRGGSYREAADSFREAIRLHDRARPGTEPTRRAGWEFHLGESYLNLGDLLKSREHTGRSLGLLGLSVPSRARLPGGYLREVPLQVARRLRPCRPPARSADSARLGRLASAAFGHIGQLCYFDRDRGLGIYSAIRALNLAEEAGPSPELARALAVMCIASSLVPLHALAEVYGRRAFEVADGLDDLAVRAWVLQLTGMYYLGVGRWAESRANLEEAVAINLRLGDWRRWEESSGELARLDYYVGEFNRAAERFREFGDQARRHGHGQAEAWGLNGRAKVVLRLGRVDEALELLERSMALPPESIGIADAVLRAGLLAQVYRSKHDPAAARLAADEASRLIRTTPPMVSYSIEGYAGAAETYLQLWREARPRDGAEARELARMARKSVAALRRIARIFPVGRPRAWLCRGTAHELAGNPRRALRCWLAGLRIAEAMAMPFERALAHERIGTYLGVHAPEGRRHLELACSIFEALGADHDLCRSRDSMEAVAR